MRRSSWGHEALAGAIGYAVGAVPASVLVARRHGVELRASGSGNPGAWNALEQLGPRRALPAFLGDGAKGLIAGLVGRGLGDWWTGWVGVAGAMAGHAFPVPHPRQGGKSVMCFVGGTVALSPAAALACGTLCVVVTRTFGFKLGARVAVFIIPGVQLRTDPIEHVMGTGVLMTGIGALFVLRRTRGPASAAIATARTA